jgi:NADH-quinone oxidoreductase subunit N
MFIIHNLFENFDKSFILELFILFYILFSVLFFAFLQIYSGRFFYPSIGFGFCMVSIFVLLISILLIGDFYFLESFSLSFRFIFDNYSFIGKLLILIFSLCFFIIGGSVVLLERPRAAEYFFVIWICIVSLLFLCSAFDFFIVFLVIELQSLSLYLLATFNYISLYSTEAGLKYFTLSSFSTGFMLFGIVLLYGVTGTINFDELHNFLTHSIIVDNGLFFLTLLALLFIFVGILFKLSSAPFHFWAIDVYDGSPTFSVLFFLILPKTIIFLLLFRLLFFVFGSFNFFFLNLLLFCAVLSIFIGNFGALYELKIKRFITYSGIANVGLLLIALYLFSFEGLQLFFFFIFLYSIILFLFFSIFFSIRRYVSLPAIHAKSNDFFLDSDTRKLKYIEDIVSVFFGHPLLA